MGDADNSMAILGSTLLFTIYAIAMLFCLFRTLRLHKFSPDWKPSKGFYLSVLMQCTLRTVCFLLLLVLDNSRLTSMSVFLILSIPDSMFIVSYILLLWQVVLVFISAHTNTRSSIAVFWKVFKISRYDKLSSYITFALTVWIGTQTCLYILVANGIIHFKNISKEVGICNFSLAGSTVIGMVTLQIRYSGVPLRSESWKGKLNRMITITTLWTVARVLQGILDILDQYQSTSLSYSLSKSSSNTIGNGTAAFLFSALIISEIMCVLMILDYSFMAIFVFNDEEQTENKVELLDRSIDSSNSIINQSLQVRINMKDVCILNQILTYKSTLGKVYKASYNSRVVFVRKIEFSRLSTYVLEDFSEELDSYNSNHSNILPIIGVCLDLPCIYLILPLIEPGSLYKALHIDHKNFSFSTKINFAQQIATGLFYIHKIGKTHGHLTSHNVLISNSNHAYITDLGMEKIKKYAGIMNGYCNKSAWSSPEILADRRLTAVKADFSDDVYSFGVILWELFTEQEPFAGFNLQEIKEKVVGGGERLEVPIDFCEGIIDILESCWESDPEKRATMNELLTEVRNIK